MVQFMITGSSYSAISQAEVKFTIMRKINSRGQGKRLRQPMLKITNELL